MAFANATIDYSVDPVNGEYTTTESEPMIVEGVTDVFGNAVSSADYQVTYFKDNGDYELNASDYVVQSGDTLDNRPGGIPAKAGVYFVVVSDVIPGGNDSLSAITNGWAWSTGTGSWAETNHQSQLFTVTAETVSVNDAFAYQVHDGSDSVADTSFKYTGKNITVGFAIGDEAMEGFNGTTMADGAYSVTWVSEPTTATSNNDGTFTFNAANAGTYTAIVTGNGDETTGGYVGSKTVSFTVDPIDLSSDEITIAPTTTLNFNDDNNRVFVDQIMVNGEALARSISGRSLTATIVAKNGVKENSYGSSNVVNDEGRYTICIEDVIPASSTGYENNVIGGPAYVDAYVVAGTVDYYYKDVEFATLNPAASSGTGVEPYVVNTLYGDTFSTDYLSATYETAATSPVTRDAAIDSISIVDENGAPVESISEPGLYTLTVTTNLFTFEGHTYAGTGTLYVDVIGRDYTKAQAFVSVDGKVISAASNDVEYDTEALPVVVVAKDGNETLVEGADYTVAVTDSDGNAVESVVEPGDYTVTVTFADGQEASVDFTVEKATIRSAEATADFFALPADGSAVAPTFAGSTKTDFDKGLKFDLASDQIAATYYRIADVDAIDKTGAKDAQGNDAADGVVTAAEVQAYLAAQGTTLADDHDAFEEVDAADLDEAGWYVASINVLSNAQYIDTDAAVLAPFQLSEQAAYADVDANAWYAGVVYTAASDGYGYMTGIPGTKLFMPEASITRAQTAQVLYNMAGGDLDGDYYETGFSDVPGYDWAAKAVFWASQAGVVTGYPGTGLFGASDEVTREQAATMLYRYVKAQGKDVSATADLSEYTDGASVSDWAAEAMQWAVANDVFGVNTDTLRPQEDLSRAEMAAIAVRVQPDGAIEAL